MEEVRHVRGLRAGWFSGVVLVLALGLLALAGAATTGYAASQPGIAVTPPGLIVLNDDIVNTVPGQPSPGGNIGYKISATNTGTSTANHMSITETVATGTLVYLDGQGINCPAVAAASTFTCTIDKLQPNATFSVTALFRTASDAVPGSNVTNNTIIAFDSQTNGPPNRKTLSFSETRKIAGNADGSLAESISLHGEKLAALGAGQTSELTMPGGFLNNFPYVGAQLLNSPDPTPACTGCAPFKTQITIPPASTFNPLGGGPFWDGSHTNPFSWKLILPGTLLPKGFKLHGVYHNGTLLPLCALDTAGNPVPSTSDPGICVATLVQVPNTKTITATGLALSNGSYQFG